MLLLASTSWVGVRILINLISNIYFSSLCVFGGDGNDDDVGGGVCVWIQNTQMYNSTKTTQTPESGDSTIALLRIAIASKPWF